MTAQDREQLRLSLLRFLEERASSRWGVPTAALLQQARSEGRQTLHSDTVEAELRYLEEAHFVATVAKPLSPELAAWRITKEGRDFVAQQMGGG